MDGEDEDAGLDARHARDLMARLGLSGAVAARGDHPALAWRRAGLAAVTGRPEGAALVAPVALAAAADGALAALAAIAPGADLPCHGALLLGERARLLGLMRHGRCSANRSCRLLATRDADIALNLPRAQDRELLAAWLEAPADGWDDIARIVADRDAGPLIERARLLGLAAARSMPASPDAAPFMIERLGAPRSPLARPLVIDLSALWAGPLAGALLHAAGARVVKVESVRRPDGARAGNAAFHDLLNGGKASVALDFADAADRGRLRRLVDVADIVIESARPRALAGLGIDAAAIARRGATWLSITAHGRAGAAADRIGYGDDAAVAGGVAAAMAAAWGEPLFAGDAIADPLTGITAALAAWASWRAGGGRLVSLALADVAAHACRLHEARDVRRWQALAAADASPLYPLRAVSEPARRLGEDTPAILAELG